MKQTYWGSIKTFQVPCAIFEPKPELEGSELFNQKPELFLDSSSLKILLVLFERAKTANAHLSNGPVAFKLNQLDIQERGGLSKNVVTEHVRKLVSDNFIRVEKPRKKLGSFGVNEYIICDPKTGAPLESAPGQRFLFRNGVPYFNFPTCLIRVSAANWSVATMSGSAIKLYTCILWEANKKASRTVSLKSAKLRGLCQLSAPTFRKVFKELQERGLIWTELQAGKSAEIVLCDPYTGEPLLEFTPNSADDPANYTYVDGGRANFNIGDPALAQALIRSCTGFDAEIQEQRNGDLTICCPFHDDRNPSCSVSPTKRCFHCFGCKKSGTLTQLLAKLQGGSEEQLIRNKAEVLRLQIEFHEPDKKAEAIYSYKDPGGTLRKQVLRYKDKKFAQRRPGPTSWIWDVKGVKPMLYNLHRLDFANVIIITEGEKDADRLNALELRATHNCEVIATTSGGADSWSDELAKYLLNKRIIVIPDNDQAGRAYCGQVVASLNQRGIQNCVVELSGFKDVSEYLDAGHSKDELVALIRRTWLEAVGENNPFAEPMIFDPALI